MNKTELTAEEFEAKIQKVLGLFLLFFGIIVLIGIFFTTGRLGAWVNFAAGATLSAIGIFMFVRGTRKS